MHTLLLCEDTRIILECLLLCVSFNQKNFIAMTHSSPFFPHMPTKINACSKNSVIQYFGMVYCFLNFFSSLSSFKTIWKQMRANSICFPKYPSLETRHSNNVSSEDSSRLGIWNLSLLASSVILDKSFNLLNCKSLSTNIGILKQGRNPSKLSYYPSLLSTYWIIPISI